MTKDKSSEIHIGESIVRNYEALKLIQDFIFDDHVKKLTQNCEH